MVITVTPLGAESLGVRSMATYVETPDLKLLLDAGVSLGPRSRLPPHPMEYHALCNTRKLLRRYAKKCNRVTISHYHLDHYTATWNTTDYKWTWASKAEAEKIYGGNVVWAKDYRDKINPSQRKRAFIFEQVAKKFVKEMVYVDGSNFIVGGTEVTFSQPIPHGEDSSELGYVLAVKITHGDDHFLFVPDAQGPTSEKTLRFILGEKPRTLYIGGPPTYLSEFKVSASIVQTGIENLTKLVEVVSNVIVDHHLLRDEKSLTVIQKLGKIAKRHGNTVQTAAEYLGRDNSILEARRHQLFEDYPPSQEFRRWMKLALLQQRSRLPPL